MWLIYFRPSRYLFIFYNANMATLFSDPSVFPNLVLDSSFLSEILVLVLKLLLKLLLIDLFIAFA